MLMPVDHQERWMKKRGCWQGGEALLTAGLQMEWESGGSHLGMEGSRGRCRGRVDSPIQGMEGSRGRPRVHPITGLCAQPWLTKKHLPHPHPRGTCTVLLYCPGGSWPKGRAVPGPADCGHFSTTLTLVWVLFVSLFGFVVVLLFYFSRQGLTP